MPIIINEFEIVAQPPAERPAAENNNQTSTPPPLHPEDITRIERRQRERMRRLKAD